MQTECTIEIDRPIDEVFDFAVNHVAQWSNTVIEDEVIEEHPDHVGTTFRCLTEERGKRMEFLGTVTRYEAPHISVAQLVGPSFDIDVEYACEDLAGRTRLTQRATITGKGMTRVVLALLGWTMKKSSCQAAADELGNLKRILEDRAGQTSD